uniref:Cytochrome P450 CYP301B1 n=1 Tax=Chrysoperla zastrowi sillemi TaxID=482137 RepID=A0A9E7YED1_9NEOP|nr:cytochrome P450 CYP301B1 [Chrysoperla zastrowi sillemi]
MKCINKNIYKQIDYLNKLFVCDYRLLSSVHHNVSNSNNITSSGTTTIVAGDATQTEWNNAVPYELMPGPKPLPLLGNTWRFIPYIGNFEIEHIDQVSLRLYHQYGNIVKISGLLGRPDMVFVYDPDDIERVFRIEDSIMPHRPSMPSLNYYKHVLRKDFFGEDAGVIAVHGKNWHNFRTKVQQSMLQPRIAKLYIKPIEDTANAFVERVGLIRDQNNEMPDDFLNYVHKWSLESIAKVALDVRLGCLDEPSNAETQCMIDAVNTFFINVPVLELKIPFWKLFNTPTWNKYIKALDTITEISLKHINKALDNLKQGNVGSEPSLVQRILQSEKNPKIACILALDMFLVGIDTTSNAVASILYQLSLHPEKQENLFTELQKVLPDKNTNITSKHMEEMPYLRACIKETLRMYPVVIGNGRCVTNDCVIRGYQVPKGVQIIFQHYVISNLEKYFYKPNEFLPERWLKTDAKAECKAHHPFASLPFGHGRRMCLGRRFADLEMQMIVAKVNSRKAFVHLLDPYTGKYLTF